MEPADLIGSVGVGILLMAFLLNIIGKIPQHGFIYLGLNLLGASLACLASVLIHYLPFIVLEGAWTLVSMISIINLLVKIKTTGPQGQI